jgi:hypothetical protein
MRAAAKGRVQLRHLLKPLHDRCPSVRHHALICVHLQKSQKAQMVLHQSNNIAHLQSWSDLHCQLPTCKELCKNSPFSSSQFDTQFTELT